MLKKGLGIKSSRRVDMLKNPTNQPTKEHLKKELKLISYKKINEKGNVRNNS